MFQRRETRPVWAGKVKIGGGAPVAVQTMLKTDPASPQKSLEQARRVQETGISLVRMAIPHREALSTLARLRERTDLDLVADIHFDYRLALEAMAAGAHKVRINPGNIGERRRVEAIGSEAVRRGLALRVGVNAGSLEPSLKEKHGGVNAEALVESALGHLDILAHQGADPVVVSLKASDVPLTLAAYQRFSQVSDCPVHLGITEAGTSWSGTIRSSVGIGALLALGIGDTIRVSLTADPVEEVRVGFKILEALGLARPGPLVIACPTCGRCNIDVESVAGEVEKALASFPVPVTVAVMGCAVNGPGEASAADVGIAGGRREGLLFRQGRVIRKVPEEQLVEALLEELQAWLSESRGHGQQGG